MDYKRNAKYFKPKPSLKPIIICAILGILTLAAAGIGVIFLIIAVILALPFFGKPSDEEIDSQAKEFMSQLRTKALNKLGLEEEEVSIATPIEVWGYSFGKSQLGDKVNQSLLDVEGKDGYWRSPEVVLSAFYFSENTVHYYRWVASLVSDSFHENTDEIYYKDIVSVKMASEQSPVYDKAGQEIPGKVAHFDSFAIRNMGGESISCTVRDSNEAERAVNGMRALLKQKKQA